MNYVYHHHCLFLLLLSLQHKEQDIKQNIIYSYFINLLIVSSAPTSNAKLLFSQMDRCQRHTWQKYFFFFLNQELGNRILFNCDTIFCMKF